jgi:hypothetical protein
MDVSPLSRVSEALEKGDFSVARKESFLALSQLDERSSDSYEAYRQAAGYRQKCSLEFALTEKRRLLANYVIFSENLDCPLRWSLPPLLLPQEMGVRLP